MKFINHLECDFCRNYSDWEPIEIEQSEEEIMKALMDEDIFPTLCSTCIEGMFSEFSPRCANCYQYSEEWEPKE
jgi:hypothetical protein